MGLETNGKYTSISIVWKDVLADISFINNFLECYEHKLTFGFSGWDDSEDGMLN